MQKKRLRVFSNSTLEPYFFLAPALLFFSIFLLYPVLDLFYLSLFNWRGFGSMEFVLFDNYISLFSSKEFYSVLKNTFFYILGVVPATMILSLLLATILNSKIKGRGFYRTGIFSPTAISFVATGIIWVWMFNTDYGLINKILGFFGVSSIDWLRTTPYAMVAIIIATIWARVGYFMVLYLAGLQTIPESYYEAAEIDGATSVKKFFKITLPLLKPTHILVLVMLTIFSFRDFDQIYTMTGGGPVLSTTTLSYYIYHLAFERFRFSMGATVAVVLLVIVLILELVQRKLFKEEVVF